MRVFCLWMCLCSFGAAVTRADRPVVTAKGADKIVLPVDVDQFAGIYELDGVDSDGKSKYRGLAVITKGRSVYIVQWMVGDTSYTGVGIAKDNQLVVGWSYMRDKTLLRGVTWYERKDNTLVGRWAIIPANGAINKETLTLLKRHAKEPVNE